MKKKVKVKDIAVKNSSKDENTKKPSGIRGFIVNNSTAVTAVSALIVLALSCLATVKNSIFAGLQTALFDAIGMPFRVMHLNSIKIVLPPYFIVNMFFACAAAFVLMALYMKKARVIKDLAEFYKSAGFIAIIAGLHLLLTALFVSKSLYLLQLIIFAAEMFLLARFAKDRDSAVKINNKAGVLGKTELKALIGFSFFILLLNMFDWKSWKYSFIGDEWSFYEYARSVVTGKRSVDFFSGEGVYGFNPVMSSFWQSFVMTFTGKGVFGWKLSTALIVPLAIIPFYMWNKMVFNRTVAVLATVIFSFSAVMLAFSHIGYNNIQVVLFYVLALLSFELALRKNSAFWSFLAALVLGLGCYTYYLSRLMILAAVLYWLFHPKRKSFSSFNLFFTLAVYGLIISLLPLEQNFLHNMFNRSAIGTSEILNPDERPWYILVNFIESLFFFLTKVKDTHFVTGGMTDIFTAGGILLGFAWMLFSFVKDWRAKVLLPSYVLLVFFAGGLVQYHYPVNTRLQFLMPLLATIAAVGISRLAAVTAYFKNAYKLNRGVLAASALIIVSLNFYNFYLYMPSNFQFTIQAHIIRYLQDNKKGQSVLVLSDVSTIDKTIKAYGLDKNSKRLSVDEFDSMLREGAAWGKTVMFDLWKADEKPGMQAFCKPGCIVRDYVSKKGILYLYDFTADSAYYEGFKDLWIKGKTSYAVSVSGGKNALVSAADENKETVLKARAGFNLSGKDRSSCIKSVFAFEGSYRAMRNNEIKDYSLSGLNLDTAFLAPSDAVINPAGDTLYVADSGMWKILVFNRLKGNDFKLVKKLEPVKTGISGLFKAAVTDGSTGPLFLALDKIKNLLYVLDGRTGKISLLDPVTGSLKDFASGKMLKGASSIAVSSQDGFLIAANPELNMFVAVNTDGVLQAPYATTYGMGLGQLNRPCYAGFDSKNGYYVADTLNGRVNRFDADGNYVTNYRVGLLSRAQYPRVVVFDKGVKKPYFAVTQPETKKVFFYLLNEEAFRTLSLKGDLQTANPTAISADAAGNMYILDTKIKSILKLTIPENAMSDYIKMAPRR